jgi:hypothetical protein
VKDNVHVHGARPSNEKKISHGRVSLQPR